MGGWVGRKNVRPSPQASLSVSQFIPLSRGDSAASTTELMSAGNWPTSRATPNMATSNLLKDGVPVQVPSLHRGSLHATAPDQFGDFRGTKDLAEKLLASGVQ